MDNSHDYHFAFPWHLMIVGKRYYTHSTDGSMEVHWGQVTLLQVTQKVSMKESGVQAKPPDSSSIC